MPASIVRIVFVDGVVKDYSITAGPGVIGYLAASMRETGFLTLWDDSKAHCIPASQIREFTVERQPVKEETQNARRGRKREKEYS